VHRATSAERTVAKHLKVGVSARDQQGSPDVEGLLKAHWASDTHDNLGHNDPNQGCGQPDRPAIRPHGLLHGGGGGGGGGTAWVLRGKAG
jgi:hypothetical protein